MKLTVPALGEIILSPVGAKVLTQLLHHEQTPGFANGPFHPATTTRLAGQDLIELARHDWRLTDAGRTVAQALEGAA